ncbi:hypothetical protein BU24DRAFT_344977 [Aaosphaeria arxii CBS 175.79]|uniref:SWI/SNF family DNA-dependent ATPase Ris1 n=1 Tax=Aaosphaeria arxii CBS 175.79 TaxID=1450172 RepID=A0A6A5XY65_9PLEO|nr:uncharacterized protein BU24DRAFT_344977 [Aaosphaeria arxii CBS 175.79]KAF2017580.1 hypothetical protein BU24DRAFT_344977 [Aaosphaeria arxii CBS 175.79]
MLDEGAGSEALNKLIEGLQPDEEVAKELREETPRAMCSQLMEHQKLGLTWLKKNETSSNKGGILADDMGLGKTVQAISLIVSRPSDDPACKTTLIVAPVALMRQWQKEIERHVHAHSRLSVYIYHGAGKKAKFDKLRQFDVVLTTYGTLTWEYKRKESRADIARNSCHIIGPTSKWHRVILDEAQCIKNKSTIVSKASNELRATYRLCMTGTPMMNSIDELYPLIRFLQIKPYNDDARFRSHISKPIKNANEREMGIKRVQVLLKSFMLRRAKDTKIDGEEICKIPPKHVHKDDVEFDEDERELYSAIETNSQLKFNKYLAKGTVTNNYANILVLLLRLRQACCHPHLIKDLGVQVSTEGIPEEDLLSRAKQLHGDVVNRLKVMENFECPICYEAIPNPTVFLPCGHTCCGECFQKLIDPSQAIREGVETNNAKCPHCRGPLSSERITDYHHFCKVFSPEKLHLFGEAKDENEEVAVADAESDDESDDDSDTESDSEAEEDEDAGSDLDDFVVPDGADDDYEAPVKVKGESSKKRRTKGGRGKKKKSKGKAKAEDDDDNLPKLKKTLAQLKQESLRNQAAKKKYLKRLRKTFKSSSKIDRTVELLTEIRNNDPSEKTLIFSQFTTLLDLVEVPLQDRGFKYQRYDGSMKMDDRADAVNAFMDESDQTIMLVSLKAGNAGLNLNKASQVIILDPFWNPFVEDQAVDRAHRMPQKREVNVHRLLVPETVEDRIITLQDGKRELITAALDENASKSISRLSIGDLKYLFGLGPRPSR